MTIKPRTLSGFRDFLPPAMIAREHLIDTARRVFRSFGFVPIDTPALEYFEILTGKGSEETDRQIYQFRDHGDRHVGMRFDLTVPLARYVAEHVGQLALPFKRYHIGKVWRGERPQRGRFREFMQCDFDTIGTLSISADIEMVLVIADLIRHLGVESFTIRVNHRYVLNGLLESVGLEQKSTEVLRALDKLEKIGPEKVAAEMEATAGANQRQTEGILTLVQVAGNNEQVLTQLERLLANSESGQAGVAALAQIDAAARVAGVAQRVAIDVSIARGLDYYTGTVVETVLGDLPTIGSVCSGGRYDNLVSAYSGRELPGIGASLGLDRMLAALEELGMLEATTRPGTVFIPYFDADHLHDYLQLAAALRAAGLPVEVYPEPKKIGQQLKYATARGFRAAVIMGASEFQANVCQVKDLDQRESAEVSLAAGHDELIAALGTILGS